MPMKTDVSWTVSSCYAALFRYAASVVVSVSQFYSLSLSLSLSSPR